MTTSGGLKYTSQCKRQISCLPAIDAAGERIRMILRRAQTVPSGYGVRQILRIEVQLPAGPSWPLLPLSRSDEAKLLT